MKKVLISIILWIALIIPHTYIYADSREPADLYALSAVLMDADSGRVLYEKNGYEPMPMASTTKIMTLIIALENGNLEEETIISNYAAKMPKVHLGVREGETYYLKDLLYSLMLESHNDSAVAIAEKVGGNVEGFAAMMNQKARDLECYDTYFITPNGLDAAVTGKTGEVQKIHSTTAKDLARIMRYCIKESPKKEEFLEITRAPSHSFTDISGNRRFTCHNHNAFLHMMDGALSGKTGFTGKAGYCYVGAVQKDGKTFIASLLACGWPNNKTYKWKDMRKLMEYAFDNYEYRDVYEEREFKPLIVNHGVPESGNLEEVTYVDIGLGIPEEEKHIRLLLKEEEKVKIVCEVRKELEAPVKEGMSVGSVKYYLGEEVVKGYPIVVKKDVERITMKWCVQWIFREFLVGQWK